MLPIREPAGRRSPCTMPGMWIARRDGDTVESSLDEGK